MFIEELNDQILRFIEDPSSERYIQKLDEIEKMCYKVLDEKDITVISNEWSKTIEINESIKIIYEFLLTVNNQLAEQYMNIIRCIDENNEPMFIVEEKKSAVYPINGVLKNGKIKFYYENTINDLFTLIHEITHVFNNYTIEDEFRNQTKTFVRNDYTETVSIIAEYLLGKHLVNNKIILQNDYEKRIKYRLENAKVCAKNLIIQCNLLKIFIDKKRITEKDLNHILQKFPGDMLIKDILNSIVYGVGMNLPMDLRYIKAQLIVKEFIISDNAISDFIKLNHIIGDVNCTDEDVINILHKNISR